ncbi:MAG: hypothetical protein IJW16_02685 [Clostridia bacterium]|nr:hypothetical protein [Clostridia bacterium]
MQLDRKMLDRLLQMNDEQLTAFIKSVAAESGIDPAQLGINPNNVQSIRQALGSATDEDIAGLNGIYQDYRNNRHGR